MKEPTQRKFFLTRWIDYSSNVGGAIAAACLLALALFITYDVGMRYFLGKPTTWVQESSVYLCMAVGLLASAFALKSDGHFAVTLVVDRLKPNAKRVVQTITNLVGLLYSISFVVKGIEMAQFSYEMDDVSTGLLQFPLWISTSLIPIGATLLSLQFFNKLVDSISGDIPDHHAPVGD